MIQQLLQMHDAGSIDRANLFDNLLGGLHAHVGLDQDRCQFLQKGVVNQPPFAAKQVAHVGIEQPRGLVQTLLDLVEESHRLNFSLREKGARTGFKTCGD